MKAKHLVSMLLAGSMILGLTACAPTTNSGGGNDGHSPRNGLRLRRCILGVPGLQRGRGTQDLGPPA